MERVSTVALVSAMPSVAAFAIWTVGRSLARRFERAEPEPSWITPRNEMSRS